MKVSKVIEEKRQQILEIAAKHGATNVRVFGSAARGEMRPDSDIDLIVEVGPNRSPWFPAGLILELEELLERRVDVVTEDSLHWFIRDDVLEHAIPL